MSKLDALRALAEGKELPRETESEPQPRKGASRFLGDILDSVIDSGHLPQEEVDDAASTIANNLEDGPDAVIDALVKKGHVPGSKLTDGGHRKLRERVRAAMREWVEAGSPSMLGESRRRMTERQRNLAEKIEEGCREAVVDALKVEGYAPLDVDALVAGIRPRIRRIANHVATESAKRSVRPLRG